MRRAERIRGFTILEILFVVAIIGVLAAIALPLYRDYQARARASDIVVKYDAVRSGIGAELAQGAAENCVDLAAKLNPDNFRDPYARLSVGFERSADGYRAVFTVCAERAQQGALGVSVAREAHDVFAKSHGVEKGALLTESLVSFAVPIVTSASAACRVAAANPPVQCGLAPGQAPPAQTPPPQTTVTPPVVTPTPVTSPPQTPPQTPAQAQPQVTAPAQPLRGATPTCQPGYRPNPNGHCVPDHGGGKGH